MPQLLSYISVAMEKRLRLCFNAAIWNEDDINADMRTLRIYNDPDDKDIVEEKRLASTRLLAKYRSLLQETPTVDAITDEIREAIDDAFKTHLASSSVRTSFAQNDDDWNAPFASYADEVVSKLNVIVQHMEQSNRLSSSSDEIKSAYRSCASKAQLVLFLRHPSIPFSKYPFLTCAAWNALVLNFKAVQKSLTEVSIRP